MTVTRKGVDASEARISIFEGLHGHVDVRITSQSLALSRGNRRLQVLLQIGELVARGGSEAGKLLQVRIVSEGRESWQRCHDDADVCLVDTDVR